MGGRTARTYTHAGQTLTVREWAARIGITQQAMSLRLKRLPLDEALSMPACSPQQAAARATAARMAHRHQVAALSAAEQDALDELLAERVALRERLRHLSDRRLAEKFELAIGTVRKRAELHGTEEFVQP